MGAFLSVSRGSVEPPKFVEVVYRGDSSTDKHAAIVGKGKFNLKQLNSLVTLNYDWFDVFMKVTADMISIMNEACLYDSIDFMIVGKGLNLDIKVCVVSNYALSWSFLSNDEEIRSQPFIRKLNQSTDLLCSSQFR